MKRQVHQLAKLNQSGMISITVTLIFMMVISLTVLGFSQITQRNSREALDRQLASQAFYAAETGANDVMHAVANYIDTNSPIPPQSDCEGTYTNDRHGEVFVSDADADVRYTCLLVDPTPPTQDISNLDDNSAVLALNATNRTLETNTIEWKRSLNSPGAIANCPAAGENIAANTWASTCPFPVLRVDLVKIDTTTLATPLAAAKDTMTLFLYPRQGNVSTPPPYNYSNLPSNNNIYGTADGAPQGLIETAACDEDVCKAQIVGLNFSNAYLRVKAIYGQTPKFTISAETGNTFSGGQILIDVTGKARDVLRRVEIRANMSGSSARVDKHKFSDYELQTTDSICKRYYSSPTAAGQSDPQCAN